MKKIMAILLVGIFVVSIPSTSSLMIPRIAKKQLVNNPTIQTSDIPEWADGNITGVYAIKNETGEFEILGNIFAYYHLWGNNSGYYRGVWETLNGSQSGGFAGWFFYHVTIGYFNVTGNEDTGGFISLFRRNETDMTIQAIALGSSGDDYFIRYALCSYTIFE